MKLDLTGKGIDITPGIQEYAEKKVQKLDKFFDEDTLVHVTFAAKKEQQDNVWIANKQNLIILNVTNPTSVDLLMENIMI